MLYMDKNEQSHRDESFLKSGFGKSLSGEQTTPRFLNIDWIDVGPDSRFIATNDSLKSINIGPQPLLK